MLEKSVSTNRVVEKLQSRMLDLCMIWIIPSKSPLNFLCWKKNYLLHSFCSWGPLSVCTRRQKKTKELLYQIL